MTNHWPLTPRALFLVPLILLLLIVACGTATEPVIVEKEVVKELIKEVPVVKEVIKEIVVTATPGPSPVPQVAPQYGGFINMLDYAAASQRQIHRSQILD